MNRKKFLLSAALLVVTLWLAGCATTPYEGEGKTRSDALLQKQFESAQKLDQTKPDGRLIFAGFAMHSQSKAFRNDVLTTEKAVLTIDPSAIVFKLSNPAPGQEADWPYATFENIDLVLKKVGALARPQDKVIVLISTHGNVDFLSINFSNTYYPHINANMLNQSLAALRGTPTLILISACYSCSFVEPLSAASRVILTASAKDRGSFGCQFHSTNTHFVDALLNQPSLSDRSIAQLMEQAKIDVDRRETKQKLSPSSSPQIFVGSAVKEWANQPLKNWLNSR